ncbi:unnamed protein product [Cochlearia groenlandica]
MSRVSWSIVFILVVMVSLLLVVPAAAGRALTEKPGNGIATVMSVDKLKWTVDSWFQRLASGPSPRGRGH